MSTSQLTGKPVLLLKEGASRSKGRDAQHANITAARVVAEAVKSALGPKGMDKMLVDSFGDVTITSDGRTVLDEMDIQHPAAKMMVEVAKTQDDEVGDGTTTVVIIAGQLLTKARELIDKEIHPTIIIDGCRKAASRALEALEEIAITVEPQNRTSLEKVAMTAMASKLVAENRKHLAEIATSAVLKVAQQIEGEYRVDLDDIIVQKKAGKSLTDTKMINGLVVDKEIVNPGMPKRIQDGKIALLAAPLEVEKTEFDAKINIERPEQIDAFRQQEKDILEDLVKKLLATGANIVLCQKGIDDLAQHLLVRKNILAVRRVKKPDMERLSKATGGRIVTNLDEMKETDLGYAKLVEERKIAENRLVSIEGCKNPRSVAILLRGGTERIVDEAERSVHDALCVVRDVVEEPKIVAGGGSTEIEVARRLKDYADQLPGREQLAVTAFAEALEEVPVSLGENAGLDPIDLLSELRSRHEKNQIWAGVEIREAKIKDMSKMEVLDPLLVKKQTIKSATEAASLILKIDDVIASEEMKAPPTPPKGPGVPGAGPGIGTPPYGGGGLPY